MNTLTRRIGVALTAALLATTAIAPMASAREWRGDHREAYRDRFMANLDHGAIARGHAKTVAVRKRAQTWREHARVDEAWRRRRRKPAMAETREKWSKCRAHAREPSRRVLVICTIPAPA